MELEDSKNMGNSLQRTGRDRDGWPFLFITISLVERLPLGKERRMDLDIEWVVVLFAFFFRERGRRGDSGRERAIVVCIIMQLYV